MVHQATSFVKQRLTISSGRSAHTPSDSQKECHTSAGVGGLKDLLHLRLQSSIK